VKSLVKFVIVEQGYCKKLIFVAEKGTNLV